MTSSPDLTASELRSDSQALLFLKIARRADELVRENRLSPGLNRVCWLLAEHELIGREAAAVGSSLQAPLPVF